MWELPERLRNAKRFLRRRRDLPPVLRASGTRSAPTGAEAETKGGGISTREL